MSNLPRAPIAKEDVIEPGVGRILTAWLRYDWMSKDKELFLEDQVRGIVSRTPTERVYTFNICMPPFSYGEMADVIELTANTWDADGELDPNKSMVEQVARHMFHASSHAFPGISLNNRFVSSWEGGSPTSQSFVTEFQGKRLRIMVEEIDGSF